MSTKTKTAKTKAKKENLAALGLPALWERFKEATGETTKSPNKKFLVRRIEEALAARAVEPAPAEEPQRPTRTSARATSVSSSQRWCNRRSQRFIAPPRPPRAEFAAPRGPCLHRASACAPVSRIRRRSRAVVSRR